MSQLRIFSYLPNPRIWKATIAARIAGVEVEVRGSSPKELQSWLWDFDAHPLSPSAQAGSQEVCGQVGFKGTLHKTAGFMEAHPFGTVPAAFSPDGKVGIFESNSIMRAVARLGASRFPLYGRDAYEASRIDSFLDASLVFARDSQIYLLALGSETRGIATIRPTRQPAEGSPILHLRRGESLPSLPRQSRECSRRHRCQALAREGDSQHEH
jgi:hypothetical protein